MDNSDVAAALAAIDDERAAPAAIRRLEEDATPLEFAAALAMIRRLPEAVRLPLRRSILSRQLRGAEPEPYRRHALGDSVILYSGPEDAPKRKTLLIAFAGAAMRLMVPVGVVLQHLPASQYDVVLLRDQRRAHYERGIPGYAETLLALMRRLGADLGAQRYRRVVTLGTSMGGLPALRGGILLGADLAISLGGRPIWHVDRLINPERVAVPAFDVLCPCGPAGAELLLVYAARNAEDREGPALLAATRQVRRLEVATEQHNVLLHPVKAGLGGRLLPALVAGDVAAAEAIFAELPQGAADEAAA